MTTTTRAALLRAVLVDPRCDAARLVIADHYEENGESERAEFVRVQVELAAEHSDCGAKGYLYCGDACERLRSRERELFLTAFPKNNFLFGDRGPTYCLESPAFGKGEATVGGILAIVRRGFVHTVRCRLADWVGGPCERCGGNGETVRRLPCRRCNATGRTPGHGPRIVAEQPVMEVVASDMRPQYTRDEWWSWWARDNDEDGVGERIFPFLEGGRPVPDLGRGDAWLTEATAQSALSLALINWARREAGLPPLPNPG